MQPEDPTTRDRIQSEQVRSLLSHTPAAIFAHLFYGAAVVVLLWGRAPPFVLLGWFGALVVACLGRVVLSRRYLHRSPPPQDWRLWAGLTIAVITLLGAAWGAATILFLDLGDPLTVMVLVPIVVGLFSGAAAISAPLPLSFLGFGATAFLPMIGVFLASGTGLGVALAVLAAASLVTHPAICLRVHGAMESALHLGFENEALRVAAEHANAAKTRFLAAASHDLRQPIHALGLSFGALAHQVRGPRVQPAIDQVEGAIAAVDSMLDALLDISKLDAGIVSPACEAVAVRPLLQSLAQEFAPVAAERGNRLRVRDSAAWVRSDPAMLRRILANLLGNALRYTTDGRVLLAARRHGEHLRFEVWDTGIGIPARHFDEIFVEFQQLGNPQRDRRQGLGLGLAIVKRLADLLGHRIGLASVPGRGSRFWIEVPLAGPAAEPTLTLAGAVQPPAATLRDARILVLDDELAILSSMRELLEHWGCSVVTVADIEAALAAARDQAPDLLIVDHRLAEPGTGLTAVARLRAAVGVALPALVITGDTAPERLREAQQSGYPLLHKPVQPARLRAALQALLAGSRARHETAGGPAADR